MQETPETPTPGEGQEGQEGGTEEPQALLQETPGDEETESTDEEETE